MAKEIILSTRVELGDSQNELSRLKKSITELREEQKKLNKQLKGGEITADEYAKSMVKVDLALKPLNAQYTKTIRNQTTLNTNMTKGIKTVDGLRSKLSRLTVEWKSIEIGSKRFKELEKEIKDTSNELKKLESNVGNNTRDVGNYGKAIQGVSRSLKRMGALLVTVWAGRAIKNAFNIIKDFEQAQANLKAITKGTDDEMKKMAASAKRLGASTIFTAKQVSQLQVEFAKLGFSTQEILNATEATLDLAAATGVDLAEAAVVAGNTVRSFGLDTLETQRVVDVMAKSFSSSALDMSKFQEAMKLVAPAARATGRSIEETTALLGVMADNGISGSIAGTQLNRVFIELNKQGLSLGDAIDKVSNSQNKLGAATDLVGDRGAKALLIFAENTTQIGKLKTALDDAGGSAEQMADDKLNTLEGQLTLMNSAWENFILSIESGDGVLSNAFKNIIKFATRALGVLSDLSKSREELRAEKEEFIENLGFREAEKGFRSLITGIKTLSTGKKLFDKDAAKNAQELFDNLQKQIILERQHQFNFQKQRKFEDAEIQNANANRLIEISDRLELLKITEEEFKLLQEGATLDQIEEARFKKNRGEKDKVIQKTVRTVQFLRDAIKDLNDTISAQTGRSPIKGFQEDIKALKEELDLLLEGDKIAELKAQFEGEDVERVDTSKLLKVIPTLTEEEEEEALKRNKDSLDAFFKLKEDERKREEDAQREHLKKIARAAQQFGQITADFIRSQNSDDEQIRKEGQKRALAGLATFLIDQLTMTANAAIARATFGSLATPQSVATAGALGFTQAAILTAAINAAAGLAKGLIRGSFAEGGFTGGGEGFADSTGHQVAGVVHANEYVVPTKVLSTPQGGQMVGLLEAMRRGSFADGGFTTPTMSAQQMSINQLSSDFNDIDFAPVVSVVDIREANEDQQVRVDNSRL